MWDDARLYEWETANYHADLPYWRATLAHYQPRRVLELACGTGRLALPLAAAGAWATPGFRLVGLDRSPALLARAADHLAHAEDVPPGTVHLVEATMAAFDLAESFDLNILGFNAFAYLYTVEEQVGCLTAVRRHLAPGGHFALDLLVPQLPFLAESLEADPPLRLELDHAVPAAGVDRFLRFCSDRYDPLTQTVHSSYLYEIYYADGQVEQRSDALAWHMYFPRELHLLLERARLLPVACYGSYAGAPFNAASGQYLWVMEGGTSDQ
jgi:SAM-dependent methyltransferase